MKKKIEINIAVLCLIIIGAWAVGYLNQFQRIPETKYVEVEVEKLVYVTDTLYVDKIVEIPMLITSPPEYITKVDTLEIIKEVFIDKPIEIVKTVYVDKPYETIVEVPTNEDKWFLGFGYQFDKANYFSGTDIKLLRKWKNDKAFSLDVGLRNDLLDKETGVSKLRPYFGGTIYFRLDN